jgi:two-component system, NarL family, response regulator LiaR
MHAPVTSSHVKHVQPAPASLRRMAQTVLVYGVIGGLLVLALKLGEYRFLVLEHSVEIYGALVAALFAVLGIWLGQTLTRKKGEVVLKAGVVKERAHAVAASGSADSFVVNVSRVQTIGLTPRELEILGLIAGGLSNREIASTLFVSENTVKTHSSRLFDKLGAKRRTQAVQIGKASRLIP